MSEVVVRYWAAARAAAGVDQEHVQADTARGAARAAVAAHPELERVLTVATLLVDGRRLEEDVPVADGSVVEILPPFAGG